MVDKTWLGKTRTFLALAIVICMAVGVYAASDDYGRSLIREAPRDSVLVFDGSGGSIVSATPAILRGVVLRNEAANGKVTIYDNASAGSGTAVMILGQATDEAGIAATGLNIACANGIYATIANTADVTITYQTF